LREYGVRQLLSTAVLFGLAPLTEDAPLMAPPPKAPAAAGGASTTVNVYSVAVVFACAISGFLFGYEIGVIDAVLKMPSFTRQFGTSDEFGAELDSKPNVDGNIVAAFLVGCVVGAALCSILADRLGRKYSLLVGAVLFSGGGLWQALSSDISLFYAARAISGIAVGLLSSVTPLYLSEISAAGDRGRAVTIQQLMITIGIFTASCVNASFFAFVSSASEVQWRGALGAQVVPGVALCLVLFFLPYSPRWLMMRGRSDEAGVVLRDLRGVTAMRAAVARASLDVSSSAVSAKARAVASATGAGGLGAALERKTAALAEAEAAVAAEAADIRSSLEAERAAGEASLGELLWRRGPVRRAVALACVLQALQQVTGINAVLYYAADLFERAGVSADVAATGLVIANAALLVLATLPGLYLVEVTGRRGLLLWGAAAMAIAHTIVYVGIEVGIVGLALTGVFSFTAIFSATWGPVVWVVQSEVLPMRARARGAAIATMVNWSLNAVIGKVTPLVLVKIEGYTYLIFAGFMVLAVAFVFFGVPETMGKSLESMEQLFVRPGDAPSASAGAAVAKANPAAEMVALVKVGAPPATPQTPAAVTPPADRRGRVALAAGSR